MDDYFFSYMISACSKYDFIGFICGAYGLISNLVFITALMSNMKYQDLNKHHKTLTYEDLD